MDVNVAARVDAPIDDVRRALADLATYPRWLGIVEAAVPAPPHPDDEGGRAWLVDLVGRLGPLARRKRVRMVAVAGDAGGGVRFERREHDGRTHPPWILTAGAAPAGPETGAGTDVRVGLHYGGAPPLPGLDLLLRAEAAKAGRRLETYVGG